MEAEAGLSTTSVFETGKFGFKGIKVKRGDDSKPPNPLFITAPTVEGTYPVLLFLHGFCITNTFYSQLLKHISSHGFIVVAPAEKCIFTNCCGSDDVESAAAVTEWLSTGLKSVLLPSKVEPDLAKLGLGGHSKGGKIAFALALKPASTTLKFSALLGIDPVAGSSPSCRLPPKIFTYVPRSFNLTIPVAVIGTGLGNEPKGIIPPFAPNGVNHAEFFNETKPPCYYFLAKDYGHIDMLDDWIAELGGCLLAKSGTGSKDLMRRGVGGITVAFLKAYLEGNGEPLSALVDAPAIAPINLDPVIFVHK